MFLHKLHSFLLCHFSFLASFGSIPTLQLSLLSSINSLFLDIFHYNALFHNFNSSLGLSHFLLINFIRHFPVTFLSFVSSLKTHVLIFLLHLLSFSICFTLISFNTFTATNDKWRECSQRIRTSPDIRYRLKIEGELERQAAEPGNLNTDFIPPLTFQSGTKTKLTSAITRAVPLAATKSEHSKRNKTTSTTWHETARMATEHVKFFFAATRLWYPPRVPGFVMVYR